MSKTLKTILMVCFLSFFSSLCAMAMDDENRQVSKQLEKKEYNTSQKRYLNNYDKESKQRELKKRKTRIEPLRELSSKKVGYIKVFDIEEDKDEQIVINRLVNINFEKDPEDEYLEYCLKYREPDCESCSVDIKWCEHADDLAFLVKNGPIISNICIAGIRNQEDFNYTKHFFKAIRQRIIKYISPVFHPSEKSTKKIKESIKNYQENIKEELDKKSSLIIKNNGSVYEKIANDEQFMAETKESYGIANGNGDSSDDHPFIGNFYEGNSSDEDFSSI